MVTFRNFAASLAAASAIGSAVAHPGEVHTPEEIKREIAAHKAQQVKARRSLAECASSPAAIALKERAVARRAAIAQQLREQRGLTKSQYTHLLKAFIPNMIQSLSSPSVIRPPWRSGALSTTMFPPLVTPWTLLWPPSLTPTRPVL